MMMCSNGRGAAASIRHRDDASKALPRRPRLRPPRRRLAAPLAAAANDAAAAAAAALVAAATAAPQTVAPGVVLTTPSHDPDLCRRVIETLGEGFANDPLQPLLGVRPERNSKFFRMLSVLLYAHPRDPILYAADGGAAAAIVCYSDMETGAGVSLWDYARAGVFTELALLRRPWRGVPEFQRMMAQIATTGACLEPLGVRRYIKVVALAASPAAAGRQLGRRIMEAVAARADAEGLPVRERERRCDDSRRGGAGASTLFVFLCSDGTGC